MGQGCGYSDEGSCGMQGHCYPEQDFGLCNSLQEACACDGTETGIPGCGTVSPQPIAHVGPCAGSDGGF